MPRTPVGSTAMNVNIVKGTQTQCFVLIVTKKKAENSKHFIILCPHFTVMRRTLFVEIEQEFIANFKSNSLKGDGHLRFC